MTTSRWIELLAYGSNPQVVAKTLIGLDVVPSLWIRSHSPSQDLRFGYFSSLIQHSSKLLINCCQQLYSPSSKGNKIFNSSQEWKSLVVALHRSLKVHWPDLYKSWVVGMDISNSNPLKLEPHHMLTLFMALAISGGKSPTFQPFVSKPLRSSPILLILEMDCDFQLKSNSLQSPTSWRLAHR
jgi:hypothetical protein